LGPTADLPLWTYGGESYGRLNHPSVWNDGCAYFGTDDSGTWKPANHVTEWPMIQATWREALRDAWPHHYTLLVDGVAIWDTQRLSGTFTKLMYDLRGWRTLPDGEADRLRGEVLASVVAATRGLERHVAGAPS